MSDANSMPQTIGRFVGELSLAAYIGLAGAYGAQQTTGTLRWALWGLAVLSILGIGLALDRHERRLRS